jgi:hypothetical protein
MVTIVESAIKLLLKTDGDLAGWLGDLAPRGDLDSTQILYRLCGSDTSRLIQSSFQHPQDCANCLTVINLCERSLPLLALLCPLLQLPATPASSSSKGMATGSCSNVASSNKVPQDANARDQACTGAADHAEGNVTDSTGSVPESGTGSVPASGTSASNGGPGVAQQSTAVGTAHAKQPSAAGRVKGKSASRKVDSQQEAAGADFITAWLGSPLTVDSFINNCKNFPPAAACAAKVRDVAPHAMCVCVCVVILQILRASPELGCWQPVIQGQAPALKSKCALPSTETEHAVTMLLTYWSGGCKSPH